MAAKGTAAKSKSGASKSKYDVEVEARLKKIESSILKLHNKIEDFQDHTHEMPAYMSGLTASNLEVDEEACRRVEQYLRDKGLV